MKLSIGSLARLNGWRYDESIKGRVCPLELSEGANNRSNLNSRIQVEVDYS